MTSAFSDRLLARPLRRDRLVQLWVVALLAIGLWSLPGYVEWGGAPNLGRALGLVGLMLRVGFWLWLLLLIVPAWLRRGARRRRSRHQQHGWWQTFRRGLRSVSWWRGGGRGFQNPGRPPSVRFDAWPVATPRTAAPALDGTAVWSVVGPPVFRSVQVQPRAVVAGQPVTVCWDAPLAEQVAVDELTGLPPQGTVEVVPSCTGPLTLTAVNAYGTGSANTEPVTVQPPPRIALSAAPVPPRVPSATTVPASPVAPAAGRRLRLDDVIDRQRTRRSAAPRPLVPGAALPAAPSLPNLSTDPASRRPS